MRLTSASASFACAALFALLCTLAPAAMAAEEKAEPSLVVNGVGEVRVKADQAIVTFGVVAQSEEAAAAQKQVNDTMADVLKALKRLNIGDQNFQTTNLSLQPIFEPSKSSGGREELPRIRAYRASYTLQVTVNNMEKAGSVIDEGLKAGVNQFQGIAFTLRDDSAARQEALKAAATDASTKAKTIADAMGVKLAGVAEIHESASGWHPQPMPHTMRGAMMAADAGGASVQPGELTVRAELTVRYDITN